MDSLEDQFDSKVCIITGAGSGIGRATAAKLCGCNLLLGLCDINHEAVEQTKAEACHADNRLVTSAFDIADSAACEQFVRHVKEGFGRIDFLFNCAGINPTAMPLEQTRDDYWHKLLDTNLSGTYYMTRSVIRYLEPGGAIVNTSSILGLTVEPQMAIYCATKYAINGFTKAMAAELGPQGIRVNAVAPGNINTTTNAAVVAGPEAVKAAEDKVPLGRMGTPDEVADVVTFLFSNQSRYMNGSIVAVHGGRV